MKAFIEPFPRSWPSDMVFGLYKALDRSFSGCGVYRGVVLVDVVLQQAVEFIK